MGLARLFSSWKRWDCPSPHQLGKKNLMGKAEGGSAPHSPILHNPYEPSETPRGARLELGRPRPRGLYLILYTTTWLQESSTVKRWLGGNQQPRSSVARAKSG